MSSTDKVEDLEKMYDEMFAYRYTEEDPDYVETTSKPIPPCPCVTGYFTRSRQQSDNRRGRWGDRGRGQWQSHGNSRHDNRSSYGQGERHWRGNGQQERRGGYRHYDGQRYNPY